MTELGIRYLYLTRHGEALPDDSGLTDNGRRQAVLLGKRLRDVPLSAVHHGPLSRAAQTAQLISEQLPGVPTHVTDIVGDYVPYIPTKDELPSDCADYLQGFLGHIRTEEQHGHWWAEQALRQFTGPRPESTGILHELVVTHNFLIGWFVRAAQHAPKWRWLGINHCHAALTVIRYTPGRPSSVLFFNDMGHLPAELRWTGFPPELRE